MSRKHVAREQKKTVPMLAPPQDAEELKAPRSAKRYAPVIPWRIAASMHATIRVQ